jgi:hypothetical protein
MPKLKPPTKRKTRLSKPVKPKKKTVQLAKPATAKKKISKSQAVHKIQPPAQVVYSDEYREYLQRYAISGAGRPRLSPKEFDRLDDELLDLLALEAEVSLDDEQIIRLQELEYLLLDSEQ